MASVLAGLSRPCDPAPHFGYEVLHAPVVNAAVTLAGGPPEERGGVGGGAEDALVLRALGTSIERPGNWFAILVRSGRTAATMLHRRDRRGGGGR